MKHKEKPKYGIGQNVCFMLRTAWSTYKSVLVLCVAAAVIQVALNLAQIYVTPEILAKVEQRASIGELLAAIGIFAVVLFLLQGAGTYCTEVRMPAEIVVRVAIIRRITRKTSETSYPNVHDPKILKLAEQAKQATAGNVDAAEHIWRTLTELLTKEAENPEQAVAAFLNDVMEGTSFPQRQMLCLYLLGSVQFIVQQETGTDERFENELNGMLMQNHAFSSPEDCRRFAEKILLFAYQRLHQREGGRYDELIQQIKEYIRTSDLKSIHLGMIADHFSYSPNYLNHIFKEVTDVTILDYITHCRIRQAKKLMTETNKNLTAIAAEVGYSYATYLSIVFKRQEGMTPKQFMEGRR